MSNSDLVCTGHIRADGRGYDVIGEPEIIENDYVRDAQWVRFLSGNLLHPYTVRLRWRDISAIERYEDWPS